MLTVLPKYPPCSEMHCGRGSRGFLAKMSRGSPNLLAKIYPLFRIALGFKRLSLLTILPYSECIVDVVQEVLPAKMSPLFRMHCGLGSRGYPW